MLEPLANVGIIPPFLVGNMFSYVCNDTDVYELTPSDNVVTTCGDDGSFTYDANPPICRQISELVI